MATNHGFVPFGCYEMPMDQLPVAYITPDQSTAITAPVFHHSPPLLAFPADERTVYGLSGEYFSPNMFYHGGQGLIQGYGGQYYGPVLDHAGHDFEPQVQAENSFLPSDCSDCVFIEGLPDDVTKEALVSRFKQAGNIKVTKGVERVFLFLERKTKRKTGCATVTYFKSEDASCAIELFDQSKFDSAEHGAHPFVIKVRIATPEEKNPFAEKLRRENEAQHYKQEGMRQMRMQNQAARNFALQLHQQNSLKLPLYHQVLPSTIPSNSSPGQHYQRTFHKKRSPRNNDRAMACGASRQKIHS